MTMLHVMDLRDPLEYDDVARHGFTLSSEPICDETDGVH